MSVVLVARHQPPKVLQPTDGAFDSPAAAVTAEPAPVLGARFDAIRAVGTDEMNSAASQAMAQRIAVRGTIVEQMARQPTQPALLQQRLDQRYFVRAGAGDVSAQWQTLRIGQDHDLGPFAAFGFAYAAAPFFAEENVPSAIASSVWTVPACSSLRSKRDQACSQAPHCVQSRRRRQQ